MTHWHHPHTRNDAFRVRKKRRKGHAVRTDCVCVTESQGFAKNPLITQQTQHMGCKDTSLIFRRGGNAVEASQEGSLSAFPAVQRPFARHLLMRATLVVFALYRCSFGAPAAGSAML